MERLVEVRFTEDAYDGLQQLAHRRKLSIPDVLKEALALETWYLDAKERGDRLLVQSKSGEVRELIYP